MSDTKAWLEELGLGQYATSFAENAIDLDVLTSLTEADLQGMGVLLGHRRKMLRAIAALAGSASAAAGPSRAAASGEPVAQSDGGRRQLTVLFADVVASTALSNKMDPEDFSTVIRGFLDICAGVMARAGGYTARFLGDGILAYFGYPTAHEDDAERAVRAGLDLVAAVKELRQLAEPLQVRVGIATGLVIVGETIGEGGSREHMAMGETPNLASRLQNLAPPNTVLIGPSTRRLLGGNFVCETLGPREVRGLAAPVEVWRVDRERSVESRFDAVHPDRLNRFVGREREFDQIMALWRTTKSGAGRVALICGEPGIGKSRLSRAVLDEIGTEPCVAIRYQCSPRHTNSPFYPVITQLEHTAGFEWGDTPEVKLEKLETVLAKAGPATLEDLPLYAALLSLPPCGRFEEPDLTPQKMKELTIASLVRQLRDLAHIDPVVLLAEDLQWIDPTTLELLSQTIEHMAATRMLAVGTLRPEFYPPWLNEPHVSFVRLSRLGREHTAAIIADVAGGKDLPADVYEQIIRKTDGMPLFIEEFTKTVLEAGWLQDTGNEYRMTGVLSSTAIPSTLHDSLMARLDRLAPVRQVAQIGAALGREFSYRLLAAVSPISSRELTDALSQLCAAEMVFARGEPPEATYIFKHALVQDAAYESLLRSRRQQLHGRIATALLDQFEDLAESQPELIAHHLGRAGRTVDAARYLHKAGKRAIEQSASTEALSHIQQGIELLASIPHDAELNGLGLDLNVLLGQALIAARGYAAPETREAMLHSKSLLNGETEPGQRSAVLYGLWAYSYVSGDVAAQSETAREFLAAANDHGDAAALCIAHRATGTTFLAQGNFTAAKQHLTQAWALFDPELHSEYRFRYGHDIGATALCYLSWALWHLGDCDRAIEIGHQAVARAEALNHPLTLAYTLCHAQGMIDVFRGGTTRTADHAQRAISLSEEQGIPFWAAGGRILLGWSLINSGDHATGAALFHRGLDAWRSTGARVWVPFYLTISAQSASASGDAAAANDRIEEAMALAKETGEHWALAEVLRVKADIVMRLNPTGEAEPEALLQRALALARAQLALSWEIRITCDLATLWRASKRPADALALVDACCARLRDGSESADMRRLRGLQVALRSASPDAP